MCYLFFIFVVVDNNLNFFFGIDKCHFVTNLCEIGSLSHNIGKPKSHQTNQQQQQKLLKENIEMDLVF